MGWDGQQPIPSPPANPTQPGPVPPTPADYGQSSGQPSPSAELQPTPARRRRAWIVPVAAVVAVALIVIVGLGVSGVVPFFGSHGRAPTELTFSQARSAAVQASNGYAGGGWVVLLGGGAISASTVVLPIDTSAFASTNCSIHLANGATSGRLVIPSSHLSPTAGTSAFWTFFLRNASGGLLIITVVNGTAAPFASIWSTAGVLTVCSVYASLLPVLPATVVDSPQVLSAVATAGGSAFLAAHPNATISMTVIGGLSFGVYSVPPSWSVVYSTCPPSQSSGGNVTQSVIFNATVNAVSGKVLGTSSGFAVCQTALLPPVGVGPPVGFGPPPPPPSPPIGTALAIGSPSESSNAVSNHWYNFSVQSAGNGLTLNNLTFQLTTGTGLIINPGGAWGVKVLGLTGAQIASFDLTYGLWTSGGTTVVTSSMTIVLYSANTSLSGDVFIIDGTGSFSGSISVTIP
jgi:hypothetical protein